MQARPRSNELYTAARDRRGTRSSLLDSSSTYVLHRCASTGHRARRAGRQEGNGRRYRIAPRPSTEGRAPAFNMCAGLVIFEALRWVDPLASTRTRSETVHAPRRRRRDCCSTVNEPPRAHAPDPRAPRSSTASRSTRAAWPRPSSRPSPAARASSASPRSSRTRSTASSSKQQGAVTLLVYYY